MAISTRVHSTTAARQYSGSATTSKRTNITLWVIQGALAALFLFAGASKLVIPAEELTKNSDFTAEFLRFIGACEFLGAIGLILPWALRIKPGLTPLAAAGLAIIMVGATVTVALTETPALALIDLGIAAALVSIITGRRDYSTRSK